MVCWILGGYELKANFEGRRIALDLNGLSSFTFFEIVSQDDHHVARIKPAITQFFDELRALPQCTQYIRDLLDLVQYDMLVVNSEDKERISSKELVHRLKKMDTRISKDMSYATERVTLPSEPPTVLPLPVKVVPSELAGVLEQKMAAKLARGSLAAVTAYAAGSVSDTAWVVASKLSGRVSDAMRQISEVTAPIVK
ncbi:hypothetical protein F5B21DRAFT_508883 [Xylaria acuta]|nr:hypothetical protein F5B21DRAFT_508883 [Xylaria acuta]